MLTARIQLEQTKLRNTETSNDELDLKFICMSFPRVMSRHQCLYTDLKMFSFCLLHGDILARHLDTLYAASPEPILHIVLIQLGETNKKRIEPPWRHLEPTTM